MIDELLDTAMEREVFDVVDEFAYELSVRVILELLGGTEIDRPWFRKVSMDLIAGGAAAVDAIDESADVLREFLEHRQSFPKDDILTDLVLELPPVAQLDAQILRREVVDIVQFLLAGHETTTSAISSGIMHLLLRPDDRVAFMTDPRKSSAAIEEILRFESPLQYVDRRTKADVMVRDTLIQRGSE